MKYTVIKDAILPRLGMGVGGVPFKEDGTLNYDLGFAIMDECMKRGVNYFDVGYNYLRGECEPFFREAVVKRYPRHSYYLADKMPLWDASSYKTVNDIFEEQKRRLGIDFFDFYYVQQVEEENWELAERSRVFDFVIEKKREGLSNYAGASFHCGPKLFREILDRYGEELDFVQLELNFMDWYGKNAKEMNEIAVEYNKPITVMSPLRGGFLIDLYSDKVRKILDEAGKENSRTYPQLGLGFVSSLPNVACILSGMESSKEVMENVTFLSGAGLTEKEVKAVSDAGAALQEEALINCTGCNYCIECPQDINVPEIFKIYNKKVMSARNTVWEIYPEIYQKGLLPRPCIDCKRCETRCPQRLPITSIIGNCSKGLHG